MIPLGLEPATYRLVAQHLNLLCHHVLSCYLTCLTLTLLTSTKWWASASASKWRMGFNSAFKGLINLQTKTVRNCRKCSFVFVDFFYFLSYEMSKSAGGSDVQYFRHSLFLLKIDIELHVSAMLSYTQTAGSNVKKRGLQLET
jgi:hypothetical protein